jgi:hypothetical protein
MPSCDLSPLEVHHLGPRNLERDGEVDTTSLRPDSLNATAAADREAREALFLPC